MSLVDHEPHVHWVKPPDKGQGFTISPNSADAPHSLGEALERVQHLISLNQLRVDLGVVWVERDSKAQEVQTETPNPEA